jgi:hypothetical protein
MRLELQRIAQPFLKKQGIRPRLFGLEEIRFPSVPGFVCFPWKEVKMAGGMLTKEE